MCTFINNQKETISSRWLKIKELFFFWQAIDRKNLTEPMQKCQAVVIRIIKMLWKLVFLLIYDEEQDFLLLFFVVFALEITVSGKILNMSPWISPSSSAMIFFFFICRNLKKALQHNLENSSPETVKVHGCQSMLGEDFGLALTYTPISFLGLSTEFNWIHSQDKTTFAFTALKTPSSIILHNILETWFCSIHTFLCLCKALKWVTYIYGKQTSKL